MAYAADISGPRAGITDLIVAMASSLVSTITDFRSARKTMATPSDLTTRQMDNLVLNGQNIERLALKIGYGV